jgi:enoyl-CoA hydratase
VAVHYELKDHVVLITIDRYEKRNALDVEHNRDLLNAWKAFRDDPDAWVAILTGVKNAFCAGGDLNVMSQVAHEFRAGGESATSRSMRDEGGARATLKGLDIFKPIIAAVNGFCIAGGMEILGGCDLRIASTDAVFQIAEPKRGLMAAGGTTARLPRQTTWPAAMELLLLAGRVTPQRALELGLINKVVEPHQLLDEAFAWAHEITRNAPLAVQGTKKSALLGFRAGSLDEAYAIEEGIYAEVFSTEDATEGSRAFLEKRDAVWKGR